MIGLRLAVLSVLIGSAVCQADHIDPCERQSFKLKCSDPNSPADTVRSQFVLRYYRRSSECVSYPFGHCPGDTLEPNLFRYKVECEQNCLNRPGHGPSGLVDFQPISTAARDSNPTIFGTTTALNSGLVVVPTGQTVGVRKTKCQHERETATAKEQLQQRGTYVPECDRNGSFEVLQCHTQSGYCWCVNHDGVEIRGTRTPPGNAKPDCSGPGLSSTIAVTSAKTNRPTHSSTVTLGFSVDRQTKVVEPTEHAVVVQTAPIKLQCDVPMDPGSCDRWETRWHYDDHNRQCSDFHYGGCEGNGNNFQSKDDCEQHCIPAEIRNCPNNVTAFLDSNGEKFRCEINSCPEGYQCTFTPYAAICCPKNEGETKIVAGDLTASNKSEDICMADKERGDCEKFELRFYYSPNDDSCKYFFYGGCGGNKNNFRSIDDCKRTCVQKVNDTISHTKGNETGSPLDFDPIPQKVTPIAAKPQDLTNLPVWTPVQPTPQESTISVASIANQPSINQINFAPVPVVPVIHQVVPQRVPFAPQPTLVDPNLVAQQPFVADICQMPQDPGPCTQFVQQWFFNTKTRSCELFIYGGCKGNGNVFATEELCLAACGDLPNPCQHPLDKGPCQGSFPRWFYNGHSNNCEQFAYSGCGGNGNNFGLKNDCEQQCRIGSVQSTAPSTTSHSCGKPVNCDNNCRAAIDRLGCQFCDCPSLNVVGSATPPPVDNCIPVEQISCADGCLFVSTANGCKTCLCSTETPKVSSTPFIPPASSTGSAVVSQSQVEVNQNTFGPPTTRPVGNAPELGLSQSNNFGSQAATRPIGPGTTGNPPSTRPTLPSPTGSPPSSRPPSSYSPPQPTPTASVSRSSYFEPTRQQNSYESTRTEPSQQSNGYDNREAKQQISTQSPVGQQPNGYDFREAKQQSPSQQSVGYESSRPQPNYNEVRQQSSQSPSGYESSRPPPPKQQSSQTSSGYEPSPTASSYSSQPSRPAPTQANTKQPSQQSNGYETPRPTANYNEPIRQPSYNGAKQQSPVQPSVEPIRQIQTSTDRPQPPSVPVEPVAPQRANESAQSFSIPGPDPCKMRPDPGQCQDSIKRWYYNPATGQCQPFQYTGCAGNLNNFEILETCVARCVSASASFGLQIPTVCSAPKDPGPCGGYNIRYYFNVKNLHCEQFVYGGCGGNRNQFTTLGDCEHTCPALDPRTNPTPEGPDTQFSGYSGVPVVSPTRYAPPAYQPPGDWRPQQGSGDYPSSPVRPEGNNFQQQNYPPGYGPIVPLSSPRPTATYSQQQTVQPTADYGDTIQVRPVQGGQRPNGFDSQHKPVNKPAQSNWRYGAEPPAQFNYGPTQPAFMPQKEEQRQYGSPTFPAYPQQQQQQQQFNNNQSAYGAIPILRQPAYQHSAINIGSYDIAPQPNYPSPPAVQPYQQQLPPAIPTQSYQPPVAPTQAYQPPPAITTKSYGPPSFEPSPLPKPQNSYGNANSQQKTYSNVGSQQTPYNPPSSQQSPFGQPANQQNSYSPSTSQQQSSYSHLDTYAFSSNYGGNPTAAQQQSYGAEPPVLPKRTPTCPNGNEPRKYNDGRAVLCLPGKDQCPPDSSCNFNGIDYFCCPIAEEIDFGYQQPTYVKPQEPIGYGQHKSSVPNDLPYAVRRTVRQTSNDQLKNDSVPVASLLSIDDVQSYAQVPAGNYEPQGTPVNPPSSYGPPGNIPYQQPQQPYQSGSNTKSDCTTPRDIGPCHGNHMRWYYNTLTRVCSLFYYGGCQGNSNNFKTKTDCETTCAGANGNTFTPVKLCPNGDQPLSNGVDPLVCGNLGGNNGLVCPTDYICTSGNICCSVANVTEPSGPPRNQYLPGGLNKLPNGPTISPFLFYQQQYQQSLQGKSVQQQPIQIVSLPRSQNQQGFVQSYQTQPDLTPFGSDNSQSPSYQPSPNYSGNSQAQSYPSAPVGPYPPGINIDNSQTPLSTAYNRNQPVHRFGSEDAKIPGLTDRSPFIQIPAGLPPMVFRMPARPTPLPEGSPIQLRRLVTPRVKFQHFATVQSNETTSNVQPIVEAQAQLPATTTDQLPIGPTSVSSSVCQEPLDVGRDCKTDEFDFVPRGVRFFFNKVDGRCGPFWFNGCEGNNNRFTTRDKCNEVCLGNTVAN